MYWLPTSVLECMTGKLLYKLRPLLVKIKVRFSSAMKNSSLFPSEVQFTFFSFFTCALHVFSYSLAFSKTIPVVLDLHIHITCSNYANNSLLRIQYLDFIYMPTENKWDERSPTTPAFLEVVFFFLLEVVFSLITLMKLAHDVFELGKDGSYPRICYFIVFYFNLILVNVLSYKISSEFLVCNFLNFLQTPTHTVLFYFFCNFSGNLEDKEGRCVYKVCYFNSTKISNTKSINFVFEHNLKGNLVGFQELSFFTLNQNLALCYLAS